MRHEHMTSTLWLLGAVALLLLAGNRTPQLNKPAWTRQFTGWQKLFGVAAFILALLCVLNPELLALGILGDSAFFDLLVLALGIQMRGIVMGVVRRIAPVMARFFRWAVTPSLGTQYLMGLSAIAFTTVLSTVQKFIHRISP